MHTMLWSHEVVCGSMCSLTSRRCTCTHCFQNSFKRNHPYGSTMKCAQCYGAMRPFRGFMCSPSSRHSACICYGAINPSVAPWLRHAPDPISIILRFTQKRKSFWFSHKLHKIHTMSCSHQALHGSWCSPPSMRCTHCLEMHSKPSTLMDKLHAML